WALRFSESTQPYGLRLPDIELAPSSGRAHRDAVLRELALFGLPKVAGEQA
ncbi:MAG: DUF58 domain-containing protein, partial [Gammaproteobacteria bacterium]